MLPPRPTPTPAKPSFSELDDREHLPVDLSNTTSSSAGHVELDYGNGVIFPLRFEVHYSDTLTDVGGLDYAADVLRMMNDNMDVAGLDFENTDRAHSSQGCWAPNHRKNLEVTIAAKGSFGTIEPLGADAVRALMLKVWTASLGVLLQDDQVFYEDCEGLYWMQSTPERPEWPCGGIADRQPSCNCARFDNMWSTTCKTKKMSHLVPTEIEITVLDAANHTLTPTLEVTTHGKDLPRVGCNRLIGVAGILMDAISLWYPHIPVMTMTSIGLSCRRNPGPY